MVKTMKKALLRRSSHAVCVLMLLLMAGCGGFKLKDTKVYSASLDFVIKDKVCPGAEIPLIVTAQIPDDKTMVSEGAGKGDVSLRSFQFFTTAGEVSRDGILRLNMSPDKVIGGSVRVNVEIIGHPDVVVENTLPVEFSCAYVSDFRGEDGHTGETGKPGSDGGKGRDAEGAPGGHGQSGAAASPGGHGSHGGNAPDVERDVSVIKQPQRGTSLLNVIGKNSKGGYGHWIIDPNGGSLAVSATGGAGGDGGKGGVGGKGGDGGEGTPPGNSGDGGGGGNGGNGGNGGDGGSITVRYTPDATPYLELLHFETRGGDPGYRGAGGDGGEGGAVPEGGQRGRVGQRGPDGQEGQYGRSGKVLTEAPTQ